MCQGVPEKQVALATLKKKNPSVFSQLCVKGTTHMILNLKKVCGVTSDPQGGGVYVNK